MTRAERNRKWKKENPDKLRIMRREYKRRRRLRDKESRFGTITDQTLYADACDICGETPGRTLAQDHCHETGIKRGRLCLLCNTGLGHFKDRPDLLAKAIQYLEHWNTRRPTGGGQLRRSI